MLKKLLLLFCCSVTTFQVFAKDVNDDIIQKNVTTMMNSQQIPGVAVLAYADGKPYEYYAGFANREKKKPMKANSIFEVGSITKLLTSMVLAQQVDRGKVNLDDSITDYSSALPATFEDISLLNLATHTSGLPMLLDKKIKTQSELMAYLNQWKPTGSPDQTWIYSNVGIGMLGYVLEAITHQNFNQQYRQDILKPLHMTPIGITVPVLYLGDYAQGYDENNLPVPRQKVELFPAANALKVRAKDMKIFLAAAIGLANTPSKLLYPIRMTEVAYVKINENEYQGLGWKIHPIQDDRVATLLDDVDSDVGPVMVQEMIEKPVFDGNALIDKTGTTDGFRAYIAVIPNKKSGIVMLVNKHVSNDVIVKTSRQILFALAKLSS